jgi:chitin disaccharide deacetylase
LLASLIVTLTLAAATFANVQASPTLAERLGYKATDRLLIINGDDTGMCHTANVATIDSLENGLMTSATIMVPCPWFTEIARYAKSHPEKDFGLHLTHTSEWQTYRWGPVAPDHEVPGLIDPDGFLWRRIEDVYAHATPEQAEKEARAQIKRALAAGIDVTHIDSHMGALQYDPKYYAAYAKLAVEFRLPLRAGSQSTLEKAGAPQIRGQMAAQGIIFPDYLIHEERPENGESRKAFWMRIIRGLKPGVTELYIHAGMRTDEMKAMTGSWEERSTDYEVFTKDAEVRELIQKEGIIRIGYRPLRDLQRMTKTAAR